MLKVMSIGQYFEIERKLARKEPVSRRQKIEALNFAQERPFSAIVAIVYTRLTERPLRAFCTTFNFLT